MKTIKMIFLGLPLIASAALNAQSNLWKIEKQGKKTSYILLSTSTCSSGDMFKKLETHILPNVELVAVEQNLSSEENKKAIQNFVAVSDNSQKLKNILNPADYQQIVSYAKEKAGMTEQMVNMFKPFYVNAFLSMSANPCGTSGYRIENDLQTYALKNKKIYAELLNASGYVQLMDSGTKDYWKNNISYMFNNADDVRASLENRNRLYITQNETGLKDFYNTNSYLKIKYTSEMLKKYSEIILPKIDEMTTSHSVLFTIDPGYFTATDNNIYEDLKKSGYTINAVQL